MINFLAWLALNSEIFDFPLCALMINDFPSLTSQNRLDLLMNIASHMYMYGLQNMTPHTSRGNTSTSSIKSTLIANIILHGFFTLSYASLFTHTNGDGFR